MSKNIIFKRHWQLVGVYDFTFGAFRANNLVVFSIFKVYLDSNLK